MRFATDEIISVLKEQISKYNLDIKDQEVGTVLEVGDGIARVYGLEKVMMGELLLFPNQVYGLALNLEADNVGCVLLGDETLIKEGDLVKRTNRVVETPVGEAVIGRVVNPLGQPLDGKGPVKTDQFRPVEVIAPGIAKREPVKVPLQTGIKAIDSMIPIGRGQRELIIGDRQTGKTAIAIDTILNQSNTGVICIYVCIGQKTSTLAQIIKVLEEKGAMRYSFVVAATANEASEVKRSVFTISPPCRRGPARTSPRRGAPCRGRTPPRRAPATACRRPCRTASSGPGSPACRRSRR